MIFAFQVAALVIRLSAKVPIQVGVKRRFADDEVIVRPRLVSVVVVKVKALPVKVTPPAMMVDVT